MPLPSFLQRFSRVALSNQATDAVPLSPSDVEATRVRARRRLIGMAVLVGAGVIGFPWLFETQPRSMSQDVQLVQAPGGAGDQDVSIAAGNARRSASGRVSVADIVPAPSQARDDSPVRGEIADEPAESPAKSPVSKSAHKAADAATDKALPNAASKAPTKEPAKDQAKSAVKDAAAKPTGKDAVKPAQAKDAAPAKQAAAKPTDKAPSKPGDKSADKAADKSSTRYVVQFGAFAEANTAHEARMKVERLGLKTYTQQVDTPAGKRIRVRMGPYADKAEADKAMATLRKAGLSGAVLTL